MGLANRVQKLKYLSLIGALFLGVNEQSVLDHSWRYLDRYYPETSEYQKALERDAEMAFKNKRKTDVLAPVYMGAKSRYVYDQMYQLPKDPYLGQDIDHERDRNKNLFDFK